MATYTPLKLNQTPTLGTSGASIKAYQTSLNTQNAGQTGYVPLKIDGMFGPLTQAASQFKAPVAPSPQQGNPNNPVITSNNTRSTNDAIVNDVTGLTNAHNDSTKLLQDRMDALDQRRKDEVAGLTASYERAINEQGLRQEKDYAGKATNLITAGGGFLGMTGSQSGVLQNLQHTFDTEKTALLSKRDAAIQEAKNAIDDKQFALAKSKAEEARSYEKDLYDRQKDVADQKLSLSREARQQAEYDRGYTDERLKAYSSLSSEEFSKLTPTQIGEVDKFYYPGYTSAARLINEKVASGKSMKENIALKNDIQDLINKTPYGKRIALPDGTFVVGQKRPPGSGSRSTANIITPLMASQIPALKGLVGQNEKAMIKTLLFDNPPGWYAQFYKESAPDAFAGATTETLKSDWVKFKAQPDIAAWRNTMDFTKENVKDDLVSALENLKEGDL